MFINFNKLSLISLSKIKEFLICPVNLIYSSNSCKDSVIDSATITDPLGLPTLVLTATVINLLSLVTGITPIPSLNFDEFI